MLRLVDFLDNYDTIIFDMDGVVTSEENYWNCAALAVYEIFNSSDYWGKNKININKIMDEYVDMRKYLFKNDTLIELLKNKGVNSNWDLAYIIICIALILRTPYPDEIYAYAESLNGNIMDIYDKLAKTTAESIGEPVSYCERNGYIWQMATMCFQEWFLGDNIYFSTYREFPKKVGKPGLVHNEEPLVAVEKLQTLFSALYKANKRVCIGTGRPSGEILPPLEKWGIKKYMAEDGLITYDYVVRAEEKLNNNSVHLTKPHPYMFLKAMLGEKFDDLDIINKKYPIDKLSRTLVVGDAGADIFAAKEMGADFCAVLTGLQGQKARAFFEENNAEYILNSIEDFLV